MLSRATTLLLAVTIFAADRLTKFWIESYVSAWDTYPVIPRVFNIVHTENRGAAFGILADSSIAWRSFFLVGVSVVVLCLLGSWLWRPGRAAVAHSPLMSVGLSLIFGGALGNVYDRVWQGSVTDFLQVFIGTYEFPSFNVADSAITVGAGLLLLDLWRSRDQTVSP